MPYKNRFLFIVQGEGRGHMTQALAMYRILLDHGHDIGYVFVGKSERRTIPDYFYKKITCPVRLVASPNFVTDRENKSIQLGPTIFQNLKKSRSYLKGFRELHRAVTTYQPDIILNFYDLLGGLYTFFFRPKVKVVAIAHQFLANHPDFKFAKGKFIDKIAYKTLNFITALGTQKLLALSFRPYPVHKGLTIVPPLLRQDIQQIITSDNQYIHGYLLNDGYSDEVEFWHRNNPDVALEFFWDKKDMPKEYVIDEKLRFHQIDDQKFLTKMAGCHGYVSTAGFESICEAMYLDKPIMMVPVTGHYEQACNAIDAVDSGAGISANRFDLCRFMAYIPRHQSVGNRFRAWADQSESLIIAALEDLQ